ncbi:MAG: hypothetical protein GY811_23810 [Myxococcales bacterium]|nr:hypothetical protein [Myxococcales bacterium]
MVLGCDGQVGSPEKEDKPLCGCGPNLLRCLSDEDQYLAMLESMAKEVRDTTAYVVNNDMKLSKLFTGNQTVRDGNSEYLYQRRLLGATEGEGMRDRLRSLRKWPEDAIWSKREELLPGQHAGVLTSHQLLNWAPDRRQRQRVFYEIMWCEGRDSIGATTEKIFEVSENANLAFTHDSWERLANTEVCTKCHARLDYGFQFFMGYPDGRATSHFMPALVREGTGPMYGEDIEDSRGQARLTPAGFARHAVKQPEYSTCMASQISNYVLGPEAPLAAHEEVLTTFKRSGKFGETLGTAMRLYAKRYAENAARAKKTASPATVAVAEPVAPAKPQAAFTPKAEFRALLEEHCLDCHGDDAEPFESVAASYGQAVHLGGKTLSRTLAVRILDQVAYGNMPRETVLSYSEREGFVSMLIAEMWPAGPGRDTATDYYLGQMRALPGYQLDVALQAARNASGLDEGARRGTIEWGSIERAVYPDQNILAPGYLTILALESAENCRRNADEDAFATCLKKTLQLRNLAR